MSLSTVRHRNDFLAASGMGKKFIASTFILLMRPRGDKHPVAGPEARFGFTVTKKMGNAVARNRIKRRLREAVRLAAQTHAIAGHDYILISRPKALDCPFDSLLRDMEFAFSRIPTMKNTENKPPHRKKTDAPAKND